MRRPATVVLIASVLVAARVAGDCTGDRDADNRVDVAEILYRVGCTLHPTGGCPTSGVADAVAAVNNALYGCDLAFTWLSRVPCYQCEFCELPIAQQIALANGQFPDLPDGVHVFEREFEGPARCQACRCPLATLHVLVAQSDVERLIAIGWRPSGRGRVTRPRS